MNYDQKMRCRVVECLVMILDSGSSRFWKGCLMNYGLVKHCHVIEGSVMILDSGSSRFWKGCLMNYGLVKHCHVIEGSVTILDWESSRFWKGYRHGKDCWTNCDWESSCRATNHWRNFGWAKNRD
jgi:hypothetical protein